MAQEHTTVAALAPRATRSDARRNRRRILDAAEEIIAERGLDVPLEEIARRAGVGSATMHRHFGSRPLLYEAVFRGRAEKVAREARLLASADDPADALATWLRTLYRYLVTERGLGRSLVVGNGDRDNVCRNIVVTAGDVLMARARAAGVASPDVQINELVTLILGIVLAVEEDLDGGVDSERLVELVIGSIALSVRDR